MNLTQNLLKSHLLLSVTRKSVCYKCWSQLRPPIAWNKDIMCFKPLARRTRMLAVWSLVSWIKHSWDLGEDLVVPVLCCCSLSEWRHPEQSALWHFPQVLQELKRRLSNHFQLASKMVSLLVSECEWITQVNCYLFSRTSLERKVGNPHAN